MVSARSAPPLRALAGYHLNPGTAGVCARLAAVDTAVELRRLSLHDGAIAFPAGARPPFDRGAVFAIRLESPRWSGEPLVLRARCREIHSAGGQRIVGFGHTPSREDARRLHALLEALQESNQAHSDWRTSAPLEEIGEPKARIAALLEAMVLLHRELRVSAKDGSRIPSSHLRDSRRWPSGAFTVDVRAPRADYVFDVGDLPPDGGPRPMRLLRTALRSESRAAAPPRTTLAFEHRLHPEPVAIEVEAVSRRTLVVRKDPAMLFYPGMELPGAQLRWKGGELELDLVVGDSIRDPVHGRCQELRVRFGSAELDEWRAEVDRVCHPHARLDPAPDALWELYARSGYLRISDKEPEFFEHLKADFHRVTELFAAHPELGAQVTWRSLDGIDGSVTFLNAWERSALIYQLARDNERPLWMSGSRPLYDLYLRATEHVMAHDAKWLVVFVQHAGARFSRGVNRDFPRSLADGQRAHVSAFRPWEVPTLRADGRATGPITCTEPTTAETRHWLSDMRSRRPFAYLAGYDLLPRRVMLREPGARFARAGGDRGRVLRLAWVDGAPVAMAWIESVADGFHLFGLLDSIRIDHFAPLDEKTTALVRAALVREAQIHLGSLGKRRVVFFDEAMGSAPVPGAVNLGDADQALFSTDFCPELIEEVAIAVGKHGQ